MQLPIFQDENRNFMMFQTRLASYLNPVLNQPLNSGNILTGVALINGATVINHLLGRMMKGWFIVDQDASALIYRSDPLSTQTLTLTSSADVTVNIFVF